MRRLTAITGLGCSLLLLSLMPSAAWAENRLHRRFDHRNGLANGHVTALVQDAEGFLWIGMLDELLRFDGSEFRRWNQGKLGKVKALAFHPTLGVLVLIEHEARVYRAVAGGLEAVFTDLGSIVQIDVGADGATWLVGADGTLYRVDRSGTRAAFAAQTFGGDAVWHVFASLRGGAYVATRQGLWLLDAEGSAQRLLHRPRAKRVAEDPDGTVYVTLRGEPSELIEIREGIARTLFTWSGRPVNVVMRGEEVWFSGPGLFRYRPGGSVEAVDPGYDDTVPMSPHLLVDHEGSLWLGGYDGLVQMPEPETVSFTPHDGLPGEPAWSAPARTGEGMWTSGWGGLGLIRRDAGGGFEASSAHHGHTPAHLCVDRADRLWTFEGRKGILERSDSRFRLHPTVPTFDGDCAPAGDGTVWFYVDDRLYRTPPAGGRPLPVARLPVVPEAIAELNGTLWLADESRVWRKEVVRLDDPAPWISEEVPGMVNANRFQSMPSGSTWIAAFGGLYRQSAGGWELVPGAPHRIHYGIFKSASGGYWLTSTGPILRVAERPDLAAGLEVLETLTMWQGLTESWNLELSEDADGTLWIASPAGLIRMPPAARFAARPVPSVALVDVRVDGVRIPTGDIALPYDRNRLELKFAALSYRDPGLIRYRVRSQADDPWTETRTPNFRFTDLAPGIYEPQVVASLDGENWSISPASLSFRVLAPWYRTWWALALFASVAAAILYAIYRARLAVAVRLERQRTRIAMDLHDEMGAGLGSIGILAEVVVSSKLDDRKREKIARQIVATASELGGNLRDILWSLRTPAQDLEALAVYLGERGARLFPEESVRFRTAFPSRWPAARLPLPVRRNLQRIALEAMHNAAKHSGATTVELGFDASRLPWRMWVADDGKGMSPEEPGAPDRGIGLDVMQARAVQIGAEIRWQIGETGGTRVEVEFRPNAGGRRLRRRVG